MFSLDRPSGPDMVMLLLMFTSRKTPVTNRRWRALSFDGASRTILSRLDLPPLNLTRRLLNVLHNEGRLFMNRHHAPPPRRLWPGRHIGQDTDQHANHKLKHIVSARVVVWQFACVFLVQPDHTH